MNKNNTDLQKIISHYQKFDESNRLNTAWGQLEFIRTREIIQRFLPAAPAIVFDIGGASGLYADWLIGLGYSVHLIDPVHHLVKEAADKLAGKTDGGFNSCVVGDARFISYQDEIADAVLFLGPLYHLTSRQDRNNALREAKRLLRPGGLLFAVCISRYASLIDGLFQGFIHDPDFQKIIENDLLSGQHQNPTGKIQYFTDAYFHKPDEFRKEIEDAGFTIESLLAVEGFACMLDNLDHYLTQSTQRENLLKFLRKVESEPSLLGASPHILGVASIR